MRINPDVQIKILDEQIEGSKQEIDTVTGELDALDKEVSLGELPPQSVFDRMARLLSLNSKLFGLQSKYEELISMKRTIEVGKKHKPR